MTENIPRHIALVMDGNGRWATRRFLPRVAGHQQGVEALRKLVSACIDRGIGYLTVFAFSSENWNRPMDEVSFLMRLFMIALERDLVVMGEKGVRLRFVGDVSPFHPDLKALIARSETSTASNTSLHLTVAVNYGGRWDVVQATQRVAVQAHAAGASGLPFESVSEAEFATHLALAFAPEPDLFIRTGGEMRVSNFLLWDLAYTEFYFTETYWPDFDGAELDKAVAAYQERERRFGRTSAQVSPERSPA